LGTQARLLRVLEYGEFIRVGSSKVQKTNVRVVAATNRDLIDQVQRGKFREDLYYRLNTVPIFVPPLRDREDDIELLFRKFSADFSEKYKTKPLSLTPESKEILLRYSFPGNIRQLKNIVEQISVLEMNREISAVTLEKYLPLRSTLPAVISSDPDANGASGISERDLMYKILFDLRKDLIDLKSFVHDVMKSSKVDTEIIEKHPHIFKEVDERTSQTAVSVPSKESPIVLNLPSEETQPIDLNEPENSDIDVQDISHETEEDESLSLEKKEKELIIKALYKNNNKRKYAARDLGISERTLYRKIKQYEIEE